MGLSGPFAALRALRRDLADLARPGGKPQTDIARAVGREVKDLLKREFATGQGPDGSWQETATGEQALHSQKIADSFYARLNGTGMEFRSRIPWLKAQHEGHVFPARNSAGGQKLTYDRRGRLVSARRAKRLKFVFDVAARAHAVAQRVLPARPIYPTRSLPASWLEAIARGASEGLRRWMERAGGA